MKRSATVSSAPSSTRFGTTVGQSSNNVRFRKRHNLTEVVQPIWVAYDKMDEKTEGNGGWTVGSVLAQIKAHDQSFVKWEMSHAFSYKSPNDGLPSPRNYSVFLVFFKNSSWNAAGTLPEHCSHGLTVVSVGLGFLLVGLSYTTRDAVAVSATNG